MDVDSSSPACAGFGAEQLAALPVASRVNFELFQKAGMGTALRVGGRVAGASEDRSLLTTDGGSVRIGACPELPVSDGTFVELVGTKAGDAELRVTGAMPLPQGEVDVELWNEAVKLMHIPQLREMFAPGQQSVP